MHGGMDDSISYARERTLPALGRLELLHEVAQVNPLRSMAHNGIGAT